MLDDNYRPRETVLVGNIIHCFDVLLTLHRSLFIPVFNQLDAQNLFHNKFYFHASTCFEHMCSKHVEA